MRNQSPVRLAFVSLSLLLLPLLGGCGAMAVGAGAGAGVVAYIRGELAGDVDAGLDRTLRAANRAVEQLKFAKVSEKSDALTGTIIARTADDTKVEIRVERVTDSTTKVRIRVGLIGDQAISMQVWERVKGAL
ncbi:DUF3568 family protein [Nibricoccus sp. IMCC34717]|uniref:DUF3568 family protein n=1 Tax=Nibricoccus sp. IMCC34717 TaxID=3034021 RepID=UPI00384D8E0C